jgi:RNA polymerase sigma-70 factor, ECF subfamily
MIARTIVTVEGETMTPWSDIPHVLSILNSAPAMLVLLACAVIGLAIAYSAWEQLADAELTDLVAGGEVNAYGVLVRRHQRMIYHVARRMLHNHDDADDVAQEAFIRAYRALDSYDRSRQFSTWLCRIAMNLAINLSQKRRGHVTESLEETEETIGFTPTSNLDTAAGVRESELGEAVSVAVTALPESMRSVFVLRTFNDMSYDEIATTLDIPRGTVMSRLARARGHMHEALQLFTDDT